LIEYIYKDNEIIDSNVKSIFEDANQGAIIHNTLQKIQQTLKRLLSIFTDNCVTEPDEGERIIDKLFF
jgi:hypothetical protein